MPQIPGPLTVISPHLDDAVFSCGCLIAAATDPIVVTVLAGIPDARLDVPDWDRAAGFDSVLHAVMHRRREDANSLAALGARPEWLDFLDGQYGKTYTPDQLLGGLARSAALHRGGTVAVPMGLFHSDHILVAAACLRMHAMAQAMHATHPVSTMDDSRGEPAPLPPLQWIFYEDAIYRRLPGLVQRRLCAWLQQGLVATPVTFALARHQPAKARAVESYESQLPLFNAEQLADIAAPERYWALAAADGRPG
ncbi:PIG-L family deacetylase [Cupriavidus agavae]|uniref:GlcNAc-PI de-N-acetylase n=1 Tax=Cupriavidus agavae TaxID=1001822 RepID=A0A4Q7RFF5_9BURK|nr:PIG-L family deacetylase [Cupriavidus agavae]RZT31367.1 GlcNAc-PI de-N-acetylase [Cupriavidus agavae]